MEPYPVIKYISRESLYSILTSDDFDSSSTVIVDVRDSDHVGGHIHTSRHRPSSSLSYKTPDLCQELKNAQTVVFHCALSQQRGPSAALKYMLERTRLFGKNEQGDDDSVVPRKMKPKTKTTEPEVLSRIQSEGVEKAAKEGDVDVQEADEVKEKDQLQKSEQQKQEQVVYVLDGGFVKWQEKYGKDKKVTDKYDEEIWAFGYDG